MNDALYIAATGMQAQQTQLDLIANNVANVNTPAYKRAAVNFSDLVQRTEAADDAVHGTRHHAQLANAGPAEVLQRTRDAGVSIGTVTRQFTAGQISATSNPMDLAVQGTGFLEVLMPDGTTGYTRGGTLQVNADNLLSTADGYVLKQHIEVPAGMQTVTIAPTGEVSATDAKSTVRQLGKLDLVTFADTNGLQPTGNGVYRATAEAGDPLAAAPGEAGAGTLVQGSLEASNVQLTDEMVSLMVAQRAYEMNVKILQAADELAGLANGLRK